MTHTKTETIQERVLRLLREAYELMPDHFGEYIDQGCCKTALCDIIDSVESDSYAEFTRTPNEYT